MKLVIDIPEHYYENNIKTELPFVITEENVVAILPKGHGELIDLNDLYDFDRRRVKYAPTIIEADKIEHDCCLWQDGKCVCGKSNCPDDYRCEFFD